MNWWQVSIGVQAVPAVAANRNYRVSLGGAAGNGVAERSSR